MTRILLAEDSPTQAAQIQGLLEDESFEILVAKDGAEAMSRVTSFQPELVLSDIQMPQMNGLDVVNAMRLQYPEIPVVLMTAEGSDEIALEALERGAAGYVPKRNLENTLVTTVQDVLDMMRSETSYKDALEQLEYNEFRFVLKNDPRLFDPIVDMMQQVVFGMGLCDPIGRVRIGTALEHALLNALFRGNLEISREDMERASELLMEGGGVSLLEQRKSEAPYCDRKICFNAQMSTAEVRFVIRDQGPGFDTSQLPESRDAHVLEREGGRGLVLIRSFMDQVTFNDKGNELTMVKQRTSTES